MKYLEIGGSERSLATGTSILGRVNPHKVIQVTVQVKSSKDPTDAGLKAASENLADNPLSKRQYLSRDQFAAAYGASPADFQKVRAFARNFGLQVVRDFAAQDSAASQLGQRTVELRGTVGAISKAFGVHLVRVRDAGGKLHRAQLGPIQVPEQYQSLIQNVFGLDTRPQARPRFRIFPRLGGFAPHLGSTSYAPTQVAKLYNFPSGLTGKGQTIAIIELGGGFRRRDLRAYFKPLGIPVPIVSAFPVATGGNCPTGNPNSADAEVMLDIEVVGAIAHGARIVVYFGPNTSRGFFKTVNTAVHDNLHKPTIISISWGGPEASWASADMNSLNQVFQAASLLGISVFVAAGDNGSTDGVDGSAAHVDFPASSPFVTGCGGTQLLSPDGVTIGSEKVWNDGGSATGGGISEAFEVPFYQIGPGISLPPSVNPGAHVGRGVPDVAGNADPATGYKVRVDGVESVIGGTSAVAPLWAGLFALINEGAARSVGFVNPLIYGPVVTARTALNDVIMGSNDIGGRVGGYSAGPGWDPCTGWGTPNGTAILNAIKST
jgi:kumamolisin